MSKAFKNISSLKDKLYDLKHNRLEMGMGLGIDEIDEFMVFKRGAFNICTGHANTGKTTVILYMMLAYAERHDLKWLIYSSENTDYSIARKLIEFRANKVIQQMTDEEIEGELNVASTLGVPQKNIESFEIAGCEGVKFRSGLKHGLAAVINRKHVVSLIAVGYGAEEFIDSFKASQVSE